MVMIQDVEVQYNLLIGDDDYNTILCHYLSAFCNTRVQSC